MVTKPFSKTIQGVKYITPLTGVDVGKSTDRQRSSLSLSAVQTENCVITIVMV